MKISEFEKKSVLILGFGKEGIDTYEFLRKFFPDKKVSVADQNQFLKTSKIDKKIETFFGKNYLKSIKNYDVIVKSPGIPLHLIKPLIKKNQKLTSPSNIFLNNCKGLVIGVTGTKGKSTTCSLIHEILESHGLKSFLIGNMGNPVLSRLSKDQEENIYIYELSSFQLATITKSPHIAVFLNLYRDHLDHHRDFNEYSEAKKRIFKFQNKKDVLIYNKNDKLIKKLIEKSKSKKIPFNPLNENFQVYEIIGKIFEIPRNKIKKEFDRFESLPHRMEYLGQKKGIHFYNDSSATIPEATVLAIKKIKNIDTIIVGGVNKGFDFKNLSQTIAISGIKNIVYFPETGKEIAEKTVKLNPKIKIFFAGDMKKAVSICFQETRKNKTCLLSPAASSFNMFKNLKQRGHLFKKYVQEL